MNVMLPGVSIIIISYGLQQKNMADEQQILQSPERMFERYGSFIQIFCRT
jgi:hypothetical protein